MAGLNRRQTFAGLGATLAMPYVRPAWAEAGTVRICNLADNIGETTLEDFEAATGIGVAYQTCGSAGEVEARLRADSRAHDLVVLPGPALPRLTADGHLRPLDRALLPDWSHLDPAILALVADWDAGNAHAMPYLWGAVGFVYDPDRLAMLLPGADPDDPATFFAPANAARLAPHGLSLLDSPAETAAMLQAFPGAGGAGPDRLARVIAPLRPHIRDFGDPGRLNDLATGRLVAAGGRSGDHRAAMARAAELGSDRRLAFALPRGGAPLWVDCLSIPAGAANARGAHRFLDFLLRPEVIAACTDFTGHANANSAATTHLAAEIRDDPAIHPDDEARARLLVPSPLDAGETAALAQVWATIKAG